MDFSFSPFSTLWEDSFRPFPQPPCKVPASGRETQSFVELYLPSLGNHDCSNCWPTKKKKGKEKKINIRVDSAKHINAWNYWRHDIPHVIPMESFQLRRPKPSRGSTLCGSLCCCRPAQRFPVFNHNRGFFKKIDILPAHPVQNVFHV